MLQITIKYEIDDPEVPWTEIRITADKPDPMPLTASQR